MVNTWKSKLYMSLRVHKCLVTSINFYILMYDYNKRNVIVNVATDGSNM